ncbi:hypothetical protein BA20089_00010 [Bifidobacterium asteroides DSM 20089]|uniref:Uncharacterized protein n=1 Tax=Bifidobacterium asteroides DSM 20089 TaxID=1437594 RepID=A0AAD0EUX5_9BIFI|nr:hypothetical protein BA20089_00010 [Bifidobacterium asteroides DSM 20089]
MLKSQGLAGTGPAPSQNVTASQGIRQGIPLDGEGPGLAVLAQDANQGLRHPQLVKSHSSTADWPEWTNWNQAWMKPVTMTFHNREENDTVGRQFAGRVQSRE